MKRLFEMVSLQVNYALVTAAIFMPNFGSLAMADALGDAIKMSEARAETPLISRKTFIRRSQIREVRLSPDGKHLAYQVAHGKIQQLWMLDIDSGNSRQLFSSKSMEALRWSHDGQYIFTQSKQGISVAPLALNASPAFIVNLERDKEQYGYGVDSTHPHGYIVSLRSDDKKSHAIVRVLPDGTRERLYESAGRTQSFLQAKNGKSLVIKRIKDQQFDILRVADGKESLIFNCDIQDMCEAVSFGAGADTILVRARFDGDLAALYSVNLESGLRVKLHSDPLRRHDILRVQVNAHSGAALLASYEDDFLSTYGLTPQAARVLEEIKARMHSNYAYFFPNADQSRWLIVDANPAGPSMRYYLYDTNTNQLSQPLASVQQTHQVDKPLVNDAEGAVRVALNYPVGDGTLQQGYVTLPNGLDLSQVPLVVYPHGGPWGRAKGSYSWRAQFLANRGYAVFEPNFRASTGFGRAHIEGASRDFGDGRVQQDILDGMRYILSRGIGDANKLGIVGHSFGGYTVLGALAFTPDLFQVGFAGAPPADLVKTIRNFVRTAKTPANLLRYEHFRRLSVDLESPSDVERLSAQSPDRHWRAVTRPLYIWAGGKDPKVNILNVREYALRHHSAGKPITFLVEPKAGHSPTQDIQIDAYFYMMEKAFAEHLGGRFDAKVSQNLARYLRRSLVVDGNGLVIVDS